PLWIAAAGAALLGTGAAVYVVTRGSGPQLRDRGPLAEGQDDWPALLDAYEHWFAVLLDNPKKIGRLVKALDRDAFTKKIHELMGDPSVLTLDRLTGTSNRTI